MKKIFSLFWGLSLTISLLQAQTDTIYIMKSGNVEYKRSLSEIDSVIFYRSSTPTGSTVTDIDGNVYNTVQIGNQIWMAENLRVTKYSNGIPIQLITDQVAWALEADNNTDKAYCFYNNDSQNSFGALYTWAAAMNGASSSAINPSGIQGVCPVGWHIPSHEEWRELVNYISISGYQGSEGIVLKSKNSWQNGGIGIDLFGFSALPGGIRYSENGVFNQKGYNGYWWSSTQATSKEVWFHRMIYNSSTVSYDYLFSYKSSGYSVRCIKD
jgi:uncharacterized protein (TIGR02145 family)